MNPRTVDEVTRDFKARRAGIIKALTKEFDFFYNLCDPNHPSLCLYGLPSQRWKVNPPPPRPLSVEIPKPRLGINLVRDDMSKGEWLQMVALHSDAWLYSVASYFCSKNKFDKVDRKHVFNKIRNMDSVSDVVTSETIRKRFTVLPEDILEEVLARLPVKDLLRYRSVCKKWRCLIDSPRFVTTHVGSYQSNIVGDRLFVHKTRDCPSICWHDRRKEVVIRYSDTFRQATILPDINGEYDVLGYVNGLVLIRKREYSSPKIILWNPSIKKSKIIFKDTTMVHLMGKRSYNVFGLGFDASTNDYKVVLFIYTDTVYKSSAYYSTGDTDGVRYRGIELIKVYSLSTNCWITKNGAHTTPHWIVGPQVYFNGAIHWMGFGPNVIDGSRESKNSCSHIIVSFDVGKELFNYSELPIDIVKSSNTKTFVTVMDDCLAIFCVRDRLHDIWVMKEYRNSNSWSKCYTFPLLEYHKRVTYFMGNDELLYVVHAAGIKSYDVKRNRVRDLVKTHGSLSTYTIFTYVESLVMSTSTRKPRAQKKRLNFSLDYKIQN